jgi:transcriptional regulator with XRE-family HTH domain
LNIAPELPYVAAHHFTPHALDSVAAFRRKDKSRSSAVQQAVGADRQQSVACWSPRLWRGGGTTLALVRMGIAERIRFCRVRAGKSAQQIAADLGVNDAWYCDLESHDDELASTLTLFQAQHLASLLGVRLQDLVAEGTAPSIRKLTLMDLPSMITELASSEGISMAEFENRVGWELQTFLQSPVKVAAESPIMFLQDLSAALGINWLSLLPEEDAH